ncbi:hypothetical protein F5Y17DRAFT_452714 [Xylariaceae sp. FL0594]|nr:hypothetical protein F5Y17DRAFT_452714 [Xylariaceae sp. FL0594]
MIKSSFPLHPPRYLLAYLSSLSTTLTDLAVCSPCRGNMSLLALLTRYAIANRIDKKRHLPLSLRRPSKLTC